MISIIIPTYNNVKGLELCLRSCFHSQTQENEIIIIIDGYIGNGLLNLLDFYSNVPFIKKIYHVENKGLPYSINEGVYESKHSQILIVNDDNVFPKGFDKILERDHYYGSVLTPNQIEPYPSMFKQFTIQDLGRDPDSFDLGKFWEYEQNIRQEKLEETGSTLPIFMNKMDFNKVGGWDERYDKSGVVCDWDFFLKCNLANYDLNRTYACNFYHFVSQTTPTSEEKLKRLKIEKKEHKRAQNKWGSSIKHDSNNNVKYI